MRPTRTLPARRQSAIAWLCAVLGAAQFAIAHAQPAAPPQPLWIVPLPGPGHAPVLPFPTPFWLWPVPWSMPLAPVWLPHGVPAPLPVPAPSAATPAGDVEQTPELAAQPALPTQPPQATDAPPAGDAPATDAAPDGVAGAGPAAESDGARPAQPGVDAAHTESDAIAVPPPVIGTTTDTVTTGTQETQAGSPSTSTRKAKPVPRLKPLPPPKTLSSGTRTDPTRNGGKARKLCWRDGKLDVCP